MNRRKVRLCRQSGSKMDSVVLGLRPSMKKQAVYFIVILSYVINTLYIGWTYFVASVHVQCEML